MSKSKIKFSLLLILFINVFSQTTFSMNIYSSLTNERIRENRKQIVERAIDLMKHNKPATHWNLEGCYLAIACFDEYSEVLDSLLTYGLDPNLIGYNVSPLYSAVTERCINNIKILFNHGVNVNLAVPNRKNETPLQAAINTDKHITADDVKIAEMLLKKGADPNVQDRFGDTLLIASIKNGGIFMVELVQLLIGYNADPLLKNIEEKNAFTVAYQKGLTSLYDLMHDLAKAKSLIK